MPRAPVCPFFERARDERLTCSVDGADAEEGGVLNLSFPTRKSRTRYWAQYCCGDWKGCKISGMLWEEYEAGHPDLRGCSPPGKPQARQGGGARGKRKV